MGKKPNTPTDYNPFKPVKNRVYTPQGGGYVRGDKYDYISSMATPQQYKSVYDKYGITGQTPSYGTYDAQDAGGGVDLRSYWDDWYNEQVKAYKALYDKDMRLARKNFEVDRNHANLMKERNERMIRGMIGPDSGRGMGLLGGNNNQWLKSLAEYRNTWQNAKDVATSNYHQNLANAKNTYYQRIANY